MNIRHFFDFGPAFSRRSFHPYHSYHTLPIILIPNPFHNQGGCCPSQKSKKFEYSNSLTLSEDFYGPFLWQIIIPIDAKRTTMNYPRGRRFVRIPYFLLSDKSICSWFTSPSGSGIRNWIWMTVSTGPPTFFSIFDLHPYYSHHSQFVEFPKLLGRRFQWWH